MGDEKTNNMSSRFERIMALAKQAFDAVDKNGNGKLDKDEIKKVATGFSKVMGFPAEMIDEGVAGAMKEFDADGDGAISWDEITSKAPPPMGLDEPSDEDFDKVCKIFESGIACLKNDDFSGLPALAES